MTKNKNKKKSNKNTKQKKVKKNYEPHIINDFTKKNIFETMFSGISIFKYKIGIYWIPLIIYIVIIYIYTLLDIDIIGNKNLNYIEIFSALLSGIIVFIVYTIIDFIYQRTICKNTSFGLDLMNSISNAIVPALFVFIGYLIAVLLPDLYRHTLQSATSDNNVSFNEASRLNSTSKINTQFNNIFVACICYIFALLYRNPVNKPKCSSNYICNYQKDLKSKQNK